MSVSKVSEGMKETKKNIPDEWKLQCKMSHGVETMPCGFFTRYLYVRLDGTMSIKKRAKIVERFNSPSVSIEHTRHPDDSKIHLETCAT